MAIVTTLIANKTLISFQLASKFPPITPCCERLINTINKGMMTGKLNIAIMVLLLPALALMPATMVNTVAKLMLPNKMLNI